MSLLGITGIIMSPTDTVSEPKDFIRTCRVEILALDNDSFGDLGDLGDHLANQMDVD